MSNSSSNLPPSHNPSDGSSMGHLKPPSMKKLVGRVLLIEDDETVLLWMARGLEKVGVKTQTATTLAEALHKLATENFHAIVTDIFLEPAKPTGLEVVRKSEVIGIPTIVISSAADLAIAKESLNHGVAQLLEKPFQLSDLINALEKIWEEPRHLNALVERFLDINGLTPKEKEVARFLLKGLSNKELASASGNTEKTVKYHLTTVFQKCGVEGRTELFNAIFPT